ncbi:MAG: hypothetical protein COB39_10185 [Marinosulfonomonas sp.]|nr:MAG: hypothetical protein COB39_10185 [Marinosulfonomonas sp.]
MMGKAGTKERQIAVLLHEAATNPNAAAQLLLEASIYLRSNQAMPTALATYLANALSKAAKAGQSKRGETLAEMLGLTGKAQRLPKYRSFDLFMLIILHDEKERAIPSKLLKKELMYDVCELANVKERQAKDLIRDARKKLDNARDEIGVKFSINEVQ